jgi:hypothetical protein
MIAGAKSKKTLRSYAASRHYSDYYIADETVKVDGSFWCLWRPSVPVPTPYRLWHVAQLKVLT